MTNSYTLLEAPARLFRIVCCLLLLTGLWSTTVVAQTNVANYNFASSVGTYTPITGGTVLRTTWDGTTPTLTSFGGPSFTFGGSTFTGCYITDNGWIYFGTTGSNGSATTPLSTTGTGVSGVVSAFANDGSNSTAAGSSPEIRFENTGTEFVVQYRDHCRWSNRATERISFQIRLEYSTGIIRIVYSPTTAATGTSPSSQVGIRGNSTTWNTNVLNLEVVNSPTTTTCTWQDAIKGQTNATTCIWTTANASISIPNGLTYTFTPPAAAVAPVTAFSAVSSITSTSATLTWTAASGASQYNVQYRAVGTCSWTNHPSNPIAATTTSLTGLSPLTAYQIRVRSSNGTNSSAWSHIPNQAGTGNGNSATGTFTTLALAPVISSAAPANNYCLGGGQTVVLTGQYFTGATSVTFNGVAGTGLTVNSSTQITVTTPAAISSGNIVVTTGVGASNTYAYVTAALPTVTIAPNDTMAFCGTYQQVATASGASTYAWNAISGNIANLSSTTVANPTITATGAGVYRVTGTDANGCIGRDTLVVQYTAPTYVAITPSIGQFCGAGGTSTITASSANTNYTYTFTSLESGTLSNVTATSADLTVTQSSAIRVTATDNVGFCAAIRDTSIGVLSFPTLTMLSNPDTVCVGSTSALSSGLTAGNFSVASIPYAAYTVPGNAGTVITNAAAVSPFTLGGGLDDGGFSGIPIGFTFNFFGSPFTTISAGTNGLLMMGTASCFTTASGCLGQFSFSTTPAVFPNASNPGNVIALMAGDQTFGGTTSTTSIKYWNSGYAPNRKFYLLYENVPSCCSGTNPKFTAYVTMQETTGIVEIHILSKLNTNSCTVGLQDVTKTIGAVAPGRQAFTSTITTPEAWRFTPPSNYNTSWTPTAPDVTSAGGFNVFNSTTSALNTPGNRTFTFAATDLTTGCTGGSTVNVEVLPIPSAVSSGDLQAYGSVLGIGSAGASPYNGACGDQTITYQFTGTLAPLEVVRWWSASTGGTLLGTGNSYTSPVLTPGTYSVWAEFYNTVCTSASRTQFTVNIQTPPAITIALLGPEGDLVRCDASGGTTLYTETIDANSTNPNYSFSWVSEDSLFFIHTDMGAGLLDLHSYVSTSSTVTAFDAGTGCLIDSTITLSIYEFPSITLTAADDSICIGDSTTLLSGVAQGTFGVSCTPYAWRNNPTPNFLCNGGVATVAQASGGLDDGGWSAVPIGFSFDFFGTTYTTLNVGTNGVVQFGAYNGNGGFTAPYGLGDYTFTGFPSASEPFNMIAITACDLYPAGGGSISYWTEGFAPNRTFVLQYQNVPGFTTNGLQTAQLHLKETTGRFEVHVNQMTSTAAKTIGVNNGDGTIGSTAPRCNVVGQFWNANTATIVSAFPWAWLFVPPVEYTFDWEANAEISGSDTDANAVAAPTTAVPASVLYTLVTTDNVSGCVGNPDSIYVEVIAPPVAPTVTGEGVFSNVSSTNLINFCGPQDVNLFVSAGANPGDIARYYSAPTGGTLLFTANPWNAVYTVPNVSASDSIYVELDNGKCVGPRQLVDLQFQVADAINISNSSAINCGPGPFVSNLSASSTAAYTYEWNNSAALNDTLGPNVTATVNFTLNFTVYGTDGYCYNSASTAVSVYDFPTVSPTTEFDSICAGGTSLLSSNVDSVSFSVSPIGYSPQSPGVNPVTFVVTNANPDVALTSGTLDDGYWTVPIGFSYSFFGNTYTSVSIGTNGVLMFSNPQGAVYPQPLPSPTTPNDYVAPFWADLDFSNSDGNSIRYWVNGISPNRVFCVQYDGSRWLQDGTSRYTGQVELYETTGNVEVHIQEVTNTGGNTAVAVENLAGTIGASPSGRANGTWQVTSPEGWLFEPPRQYDFLWLPAIEISGSNTGSTALAQPSVSTTYQLIVTDEQTTCDNSVNNQTFVNVNLVSAPPVANFTASPLVGTSGGIITTHDLDVAGAIVGGDTYQWTITPATHAFVNGTSATDLHAEVQFTAAGNYSVQLIVNRCTGSDTAFIANLFSITPVYCFPSFTFGGDGCSDGDAINDVTIKDANNVTIMSHLGTGCGGGANGYNDYTTPSLLGTTTCNLVQGSSYTLGVTSISAIYSEGFGAWLDVNDDGDFADAGEFMGGAAPAPSASFTIGIPSSNVTYGPHRMRIIAAFANTLDATEFCVNGTYGETHDYLVNIVPPVISNDIPTFAALVQYSSNMNYPNCAPVTGNTSLASNSPESAATTGPDLWYRFVAQSTGVSIQMSSTTMDDAIALYTKDLAGNYNLVAGGTENASTGLSDFERLNIGGLTPGTTYYVSVGAASGLTGGAFTLCVQHLMKSWCAYTIPVGGFDLCAGYKAIFRGSPAQGVTYNFNFTGTGGTAPLVTTSLTGTNGLTTLSQPSLALRYGGVYNAKVDVVYSLSPSSGTDAPITVLGSVTDANCTGVTIRTQPLLEVRANQRCSFPATLLRSSWLVGVPVAGSNNVCSATNYTYEFTQVVSCGDGTVVSAFPVEYTTIGNTPFLQLGVLSSFPNQGAWDVRIRPNFTYGNGSYGPTQRIVVNGTAAGTTLDEASNGADAEKTIEFGAAANLYPNPNTGEIVNLNVSGVESDNVFVRIVDAMGRVVYSNRFTVEGSLNTVVTFAEPLASGLYSVEFHVDGEVMTERMIVTKQ